MARCDPDCYPKKEPNVRLFPIQDLRGATTFVNPQSVVSVKYHDPAAGVVVDVTVTDLPDPISTKTPLAEVVKAIGDAFKG
jgi:hypothetical protein